jgi:hypothetical protein
MVREEGETRHPATATFSRIEAAHQRIRNDLAVLGKSDDLGEIRAVVDNLSDLLKEHFQDEVKRGGLFEELESLRPGLSPQLKSLSEEHREIMQALDGLQQELRGVDPLTEVDELEERHDHIRVAVAVFLQLIHQHERIESRLVADTYYIEDGGFG